MIISTSQQGYSAIDIKFDFSVTPEVALRKVKDKVDIAMSDPSFPDDLPSDPNIFDLNFTELIPVMQVNLSGDYPIDQLEDYAERCKTESKTSSKSTRPKSGASTPRKWRSKWTTSGQKPCW